MSRTFDTLDTRILPVPASADLGRFRTEPGTTTATLEHWDAADSASPGMASLATAAAHIRDTDTPVGFPTETVYGLGADATRSSAVRGIFAVKGRPSDNPLIVHVCDLAMLRRLLPKRDHNCETETIPPIYRDLIARFWPGPLTILLPVPPADLPRARAPDWTLAPEVTAGLATFGARLPASALTRSLIRLADAPLAGPSANASTRPSPTTAQHVVDDLAGRVQVVLDGGACGVGVESTVVDGLCDPPVVLRPGGVSLGELRTVPGWERVERAYHDVARGGNADPATRTADEAELKPRAPGMKYKHYSPKARVVLYEDWRHDQPLRTPATFWADLQGEHVGHETVGLIRTVQWPQLGDTDLAPAHDTLESGGEHDTDANATVYRLREFRAGDDTTVLELDVGRDVPSIAHGLFSALRDLDARGVSVILVEGVDDRGDDMAAAVMNRLRKAASVVR